MRRIRGSLSYANVMATVAVFLALGGGAYAALKLPRNSVGTTQIKNNAVVSSKVKNGSLLSKDFRAGQLPQGPKGDTGAKGETGAKGDPGSVFLPKVTAAGSSGAQNFTVNLSPPEFSFTPAAGKGDIELIRVDWTPPAASCSGAGGRVTIRLDGAQVGQQDAAKGGAAQTLVVSLAASAPTAHAVSVGLADDCAGSENLDATATVERVEVG
jgi:hypothetical protein